MIAYFDASSLVKLLVDEDDSAQAASIWEDAALRFTSIMSYAECCAAIAAATRTRRLTRDRLLASRALLDAHWEELARLEVNESLVRLAGDLADRHALRGYDAVHLASATRAGDDGTILFVTWDRTLARAALGEGLAVAPA